MQNVPTRATGEAVSAPSLRRKPADPLFALIATFQAEDAVDARLGDEEIDNRWQAAGSSYGSAFERLRDNPPAAISMAGVEAALRLMAAEDAKGNDWLRYGFLEAAVLPFFAQEAAR